ncbi:type II secretion system protein N [Marinobacter sp. VGCF2001]|uniref:type II secretion system protein N n=1 Tax=Marinobacter sp. VGCF2001 TaxID=3417189 RepID=UPI003CEE40B0
MLAINQRTPLLLAVAATVTMLSLTGWQAYQFWLDESRSGLSRSISALPADTKRTSTVPDVSLSGLEIFGSATQSAQAGNSSTENLPETNLRLSLRGVLAADGDFPGSALVEDDKGKTEAYLVGDELPGNATLRTVFANRVIIERAGKLENLYFPETEDRAGVDVASNADLPSNASATQQAPTRRVAPQSAASATDQQQRREDIRKRLEQLRQRLQNNN